MNLNPSFLWAPSIPPVRRGLTLSLEKASSVITKSLELRLSYTETTMKFLRSLALPVILFAAAVTASAQEAPKDAELNEATYGIWRDHVLPRGWELNYQKIGWRTSFWDAVVEANEKDKPILMWAMNGHPLCNV